VPEYTAAALVACAFVVVLDAYVLGTHLLRRLDYWLTMVIVLSFQIPVDGWLTKGSAPIVLYDRAATSGFRPVWDIPVEDFLFGFAMVTLVLLLWQRRPAT
jgi:lycopene cyclase domain-containing protein